MPQARKRPGPCDSGYTSADSHTPTSSDAGKQRPEVSSRGSGNFILTAELQRDMGNYPMEVCPKQCLICLQHNETVNTCCHLRWSLHHEHICRTCMKEISQGQRRWDGVPLDSQKPQPENEWWRDTVWEREHLVEAARVQADVVLSDPVHGVTCFDVTVVSDTRPAHDGDLSPTAPYRPPSPPSQLMPPPPTECQNCSTGFMGGFAEQHWEDHLRTPANGETDPQMGDLPMPARTPAQLEDDAETWYAEVLSLRRDL